MKKLMCLGLVFSVACLLSGCGTPGQSKVLEDSAGPSWGSDSGLGSKDLSSEFPSEWNSDEKEVFEVFASAYPTMLQISLSAKRAQMDNAHLICTAFSEGYSRREILAVTTGESITSAMADDWMSLAVMKFCPEYKSLQIP